MGKVILSKLHPEMGESISRYPPSQGWLIHPRMCRRVSRRCQPHAGDFLNAIPTCDATSMDTELYQCALQRRLGLPLFPAPPAVDRHGKPIDRFGDSMQNEGCHTHRHDQVKYCWYDAMTATYGSQYTICDPTDGSDQDYSPTYTPDIGVLYHSNDGKHLLGDVKVVSPFVTSFESVEAKARAAVVGFANTGEHLKEKVKTS